MTETAMLEKYFREEVLDIADATFCFGDKLFNTFPPAKPSFPYAVFKVIPLQDNFGQARHSIQSRFLIDFKIVSALPLPATVDEAVAAVKAHFQPVVTFGDFRISIRHEMPINLAEQGSNADEKIISRGSTFRAWMTRV